MEESRHPQSPCTESHLPNTIPRQGRYLLQGGGGGVKAPPSKAPPIPREPSPLYASPPPRQIPPPRRRWRSQGTPKQGTPNPPRAISPIRFPPGKADTSSKEEVEESRHPQARHAWGSLKSRYIDPHKPSKGSQTIASTM